MPELPEVEVTKNGIAGYLIDQKITKVYFDDKSLRKPFLPNLYNLEGAEVRKVERRAKYIIIMTTKGYLLLHLGMTGHLTVLDKGVQRALHDHFEIELSNKKIIRLNDIRRFGLVLYYPLEQSPYESEYLKDLGPEPFSDEFNAEYLYSKLSRHSKSIKQTITDNYVVVGIGNIYASEVLFKTKINPTTPANKISLRQCQNLVSNIRDILSESINKGGTTIRDFSGADGRLGYFVQNLNVYGHKNDPCPVCGHKIVSIIQGQRSTFYCPNCQK